MVHDDTTIVPSMEPPLENIPVEGPLPINNARQNDSAENSDREEQGAGPTEEGEDAGAMSLLEHLQELRKRLVWMVLAILFGFILCYGFAEEIFAFVVAPLVVVLPPTSKLIFTSLPEAFFVYLKISLLAGVFLMSPFLFYQLWAFIAPGLYKNEKLYAILVGIFSALFFIGGGAFCYYQVFPVAFTFFLSFSNDFIEPLPSLDLFLSFALKLLLAFGLIAQMPLFAFFLGRLGLVSVQKMVRFRKYFVLIAFVVAAILTPPDVFSQALMAIPMLLLYELSIGIVYCIEYKKRKHASVAESEARADTP